MTNSPIENGIHDQYHEKGLVVLAHMGMQHLSELEQWNAIIYQDFNTYQGGIAPYDKWNDTVYTVDDQPPHIDIGYHRVCVTRSGFSG